MSVYVRNNSPKIRLQLFSTNIDENEVCTKKNDQIFKETDTHSPLYIKNEHRLCDW